MANGLYGKLPIKRDFIAENVPRGFLPMWEPWLQGAVAASRMELGSRWQAIYLSAPIWRFWIGHAHCGRTVTGAFMPSVDGVGRYFPLTLMAMAEEGEGIQPPTRAPAEDWYMGAEDLLLSALEETVVFDDLIAALAAMPTPATTARVGLPEGARLLPDGLLVAVGANATSEAAFSALSAATDAGDLATATFWWTIGGGDFPAMAISGRRLPDPSDFSGLLTGRFDR